MKESKVGGRIGIHVPGHPKANNRGYVLKHRYIMEQYLGRFLDSEEHVHHCNRDKEDNRIENLELVTNEEHMRMHIKENGIGQRKLDYEAIAGLRREGYGYKRIAKALNYSRGSVKSAVWKMERGHF